MNTTIPSAVSVAERVKFLINSDGEADALLDRAHAVDWASERELNTLDWGVVYGLCFAIVHSSDPWVTARIAAPIAYEAARLVMDDWAGVSWNGASTVEVAA